MYLNPEPDEKLAFEALWAKGLPLTVKRFEDPRPVRPADSAGQLWVVIVSMRPVTQTSLDSAIPGAHRVLATGEQSVAPTFINVKPVQCETWSREAMAGTGRQHRHSPSCQVSPLTMYAPTSGWWTKREFDFADPVDGLLAAMRWDPETEPEPFGWIKQGDRLRPGADPMAEFQVREDAAAELAERMKESAIVLSDAATKSYIDQSVTENNRFILHGTPAPPTAGIFQRVATDPGRTPQVGDVVLVTHTSDGGLRIVTDINSDGTYSTADVTTQITNLPGSFSEDGK